MAEMRSTSQSRTPEASTLPSAVRRESDADADADAQEADSELRVHNCSQRDATQRNGFNLHSTAYLWLALRCESANALGVWLATSAIVAAVSVAVVRRKCQLLRSSCSERSPQAIEWLVRRRRRRLLFRFASPPPHQVGVFARRAHATGSSVCVCVAQQSDGRRLFCEFGARDSTQLDSSPIDAIRATVGAMRAMHRKSDTGNRAADTLAATDCNLIKGNIAPNSSPLSNKVDCDELGALVAVAPAKVRNYIKIATPAERQNNGHALGAALMNHA